ncbi:hypothetical protein AwWohl_01390 [Gammaproteobacteria bacterium]|nr:hypothetical protein AwWohl_01390 [Gammaproteobacteria bacterium]
MSEPLKAANATSIASSYTTGTGSLTPQGTGNLFGTMAVFMMIIFVVLVIFRIVNDLKKGDSSKAITNIVIGTMLFMIFMAFVYLLLRF